MKCASATEMDSSGTEHHGMGERARKRISILAIMVWWFVELAESRDDYVVVLGTLWSLWVE